MILSAVELAEIVKEVAVQLLKLSEVQEIALMKKIDSKIAEAMDQHLDDYEHQETQCKDDRNE